jgi:succinate dehydrogenase / fumarate reductase cytochrome b subunit
MSLAELPPESKAYPGQSARLPGRQVGSWFTFWKRSLGTWGFVLNRVAGLALVFYLMLHLVVLSLLTRGPEGWDPFVALARSPAFLLLDVVLLAGIIGHGLNGLRVALIGTGILVRWQRQLLVGLAVIGVLLLILSGILVFSM